jgi:predicted RND superfamily exporter protein
MLPTVFGLGVLWLAVFPAIGQFGILTALSIAYAFLASLLVLPSTIIVWDRVFNAERSFRDLLSLSGGRKPSPVEGDD